MKSTHSGHCQACGRLQKMPSGKMSLHGYTVSHGYFHGQCAGSKELPFELSCDLVKTFIASAQAHLDGVLAFQTELRTPATTPRAWVHNYEARPLKTGCNHYNWRVVDILEETHTSSNDYTYKTFSYKAPGVYTSAWSKDTVADTVHKIGYGEKNALEVATVANARYADWLDHEVTSLRRYIKWQTERVNTWKVAPLFPNDYKDKLGFVPTEAKY